MPEIKHPISGKVIQGRRLKLGEMIQTTDVYDSTSGDWEHFSLSIGAIVKQNNVIWVRPDKADSSKSSKK